MDVALARAGAEAILPRGEGDARADFFGDFEAWYASFWGARGARTGVDAPVAARGPLYEVEIASAAIGDFVRQNRLDYVTVLENHELVDVTSPFGRSKRHLEFALPEGATYAAGDYLAILAENHPELIMRAARRFGLRPDVTVTLRSTRGAMAASLPTDRPVSLHELLGCYVELAQPATRRDVEALADATPCPPHRDELRALAGDAARYQADILEKRVSVLDLLERYPSCDIPFAAFLELLPAMRVRQYSIASSPLAGPARCALTVAVVEGSAWSDNGTFHGLCSSHLARRQPGERVPAAIRTPNVPFRPPASNAEPMVMICAGTGLAPFRGFVEERALRRRAGEPAGEALLFFGCDHPDVDFLYRDELAAWQDEDAVTIFPAYFRQPDGDIIFVQHRLWQERARIRELFAKGATFYLCGDGLLMAPAVRQTLARIHQEESGCTEAEAEAWLRALEREGRFVPDVFG
jgi:cytochrome P450/NADPH-cytochrome P450 reductase